MHDGYKIVSHVTQANYSACWFHKGSSWACHTYPRYMLYSSCNTQDSGLCQHRQVEVVSCDLRMYTWALVSLTGQTFAARRGGD